MRPARILFAGLFGIAAMNNSSMVMAAQSSVQDSAAKIQKFGGDPVAQARCKSATLKAGRALDHNRSVNFSAWEKDCPAFGPQLQFIAQQPPILQKGSLRFLFHGDIGSRGRNDCIPYGFGAIC